MRLLKAAPVIALLFALLSAACAGNVAGPSGSPTPAGPATQPATVPPSDAPGQLVVMTHDSFAVSPQVMAGFEQQHRAAVQVLQVGDAGSLVNQAILTRDNPLADVLYGVDNTFLSRALEAGIFEPYISPLLEHVPVELRGDAEDGVTPIDYGDVCLNWDRAAFEDAGTPPPATLADLTQPRYAGMLVVENPATSSPGLAFMLATIVRFGESGSYAWLDYWRDLRANDVLVSAGWEEAYYGSFSGGSGEGDRPIVVSYATSPAAEVYYADPQPAEAPTGVVDDGCFRQIEFAGVLAGRSTGAEALARDFIDFMLSTDFQADIPLNMFVFPANAEAVLPDVFAEHAVAVTQPIVMDAQRIAANREQWLQEWTNVVLR